MLKIDLYYDIASGNCETLGKTEREGEREKIPSNRTEIKMISAFTAE